MLVLVLLAMLAGLVPAISLGAVITVKPAARSAMVTRETSAVSSPPIAVSATLVVPV